MMINDWSPRLTLLLGQGLNGKKGKWAVGHASQAHEASTLDPILTARDNTAT